MRTAAARTLGSAAPRRVAATCEAATGRYLATQQVVTQQVVEREVQPCRQLQHRLEREAALSALCLRDRARWDAGRQAALKPTD